MSAPRLGIGMPVYNGERYVRQAVESHLAQTFGDFELVIADNQSTDGTQDICRDLAAADPRIRYVRNDHNLGGPGNFRRVFELCRGEYHKWSTADDWWAPTMLARGVAVLDEHPDVVLTYPKTVLVTDAGDEIQKYEDDLHLIEEEPSRRFIRLIETIDLCQAHLGIIRREAMARTRLIGTELKSDFWFLAELTLYGKFHVIPEYLFYRRFHETSSSWDRHNMAHQQKYYDPERRGTFRFHTWKRYARLLDAVRRAPISGTEKRKLYAWLGRRIRWSRWTLLRELRDFRRPRSRAQPPASTT